VKRKKSGLVPRVRKVGAKDDPVVSVRPIYGDARDEVIGGKERVTMKDAALEFRLIARKLGYTRRVAGFTYANPVTREQIKLLRVAAGVLTIKGPDNGTYTIDLNAEGSK